MILTPQSDLAARASENVLAASMARELESPQIDGARKRAFLSAFKKTLIVARSLSETKIDRITFNAWMADDRVFKQTFYDLWADILDMALELAFQESGMLNRPKTRRARPIDRAMLREFMRKHPLLVGNEGETPKEQRVISIAGVDGNVLIQLVSGQKKPEPNKVIDVPAEDLVDALVPIVPPAEKASPASETMVE